MKLSKSLWIVALAGGALWAQTPGQTAMQLAGQAKNSANSAGQQTKSYTAPAEGKAKTTVPATHATVKTTPVKTESKATAKPLATKTENKAPAKATAMKTESKGPAKTVANKPAAKPATASAKPVAIPKKAATIVKTHVAPKAKVAVAKKEKSAQVETPKAASVKEKTDESRVYSHASKRDPFVSPIVRASVGGGPICETGKRCLMVDQILLRGIVKSPSGYIAVVENAAKRAYFLRENDPVFNGAVEKITGDSVVFREQVTDKFGKPSWREVTKRVNAPVV